MRNQTAKLILILVSFGLLLSAVFLSPVKAEDNSSKAGDKGPLTKITFIHYRKGTVKPIPDATLKNSNGSSCFSYLANGAKWKTIEDYIVNPTNSGLGGTFVQQAVDRGVAEWERYGGSSIFGSGSSDPTAGGGFDYKNVVTFGAYDNDNVIAVTTVWGYFFGVPSTRELVEWDMLFNNAYPFGDAIASGGSVMDLQNIATHELGHSAGMGDLYSASCFSETMYGYSGYGETIKRDLGSGDIQGIKKLYR